MLLQKRKQSSQPPTNGVGSPHERGLLYKPELHSVADRVRYIERAHSRWANLRPHEGLPVSLSAKSALQLLHPESMALDADELG